MTSGDGSDKVRTYNKDLQVPLSSGMRDSTAKGDRMVYIHFALLFACIIYAAKLGGIGVGMARRVPCPLT